MRSRCYIIREGVKLALYTRLHFFAYTRRGFFQRRGQGLVIIPDYRTLSAQSKILRLYLSRASMYCTEIRAPEDE